MSLPEPRAESRAVVTGASSGIGAELADLLAARGHALLLVARRQDRLTELAERLTTRHGVVVETRACDLADRAARRDLAAELAERPVAVLCNNAGFATFGQLAELDGEREREEIELNVVAVHDLTLAVLPGMVRRGAGAILITGSTAGVQPIPGQTTYAASKAFANSFAESLHGELRGTGVTCTLLAPGPVRTEFTKVAGVESTETTVPGFVWESARRVAEAAIAGLERGRRRVVPGVPAQAMTLSQYVPHGVLLPAIRRVYGRYGL
jgi:short-subunit dehydrogenase